MGCLRSLALAVAACILASTAAAQSSAFASAGGPFAGFPNFPGFDMDQFMPKDPCGCPADKFCPPEASSKAACLPRTCANWVKHNCPAASGPLRAIDCSKAMAEAAGRMSTSATFDACYKSSTGDVLCMQGPGALAADCSDAGGGQTVNTWSNGGNGGTASSSSSVGGGSGSTFASTSNDNGGATSASTSSGGRTGEAAALPAGPSSTSDPAAAAAAADVTPAVRPSTTIVPTGPGSVQQVQGGAAPGQAIQQVQAQRSGAVGAGSAAQVLAVALAAAAAMAAV